MKENKPLKRVGVVGTRAVVEDGPFRWTVCCATCDAKKATFGSSSKAMDFAVKTSNKRCALCGAH